jgi:threonine dehydrogenase-like Zn-dependent dehydrogenase
MQGLTNQAIIFDVTPFKWVLGKTLGRFWKGFFTSRLGGLTLKEIEAPKLPSDDWVLCRTILGGICGTDIAMITMKPHPASMIKKLCSIPMSLGHENVGLVETVGKSVDENLIGKRVIVDPALSCQPRGIEPMCLSCERGRPSTCLNVDQGGIAPGIGVGYNRQTGGSWSTLFTCHKSQIHPIPDSISDEQAILIDPLACSLHAVLANPPKEGEKILIFGAGMIAMGILIMLRALKFTNEITITTRHPFQSDLAKHYGANNIVHWRKNQDSAAMKKMADITGGRMLTSTGILHFLQGGFDRVYDCSGTITGMIDASRLIRPGGKLIVAGTPQLGLIDLTALWFRELEVIGVTGRAVETLTGESEPRHNYEHVISMMSDGRIDASKIPIGFYRQHEFRKAIRELQNRRRTPTLKSVFDFR